MIFVVYDRHDIANDYHKSISILEVLPRDLTAKLTLIAKDLLYRLLASALSAI